MSDLQVLDKMVSDNMDIAAFPDLIEANKIKGGFKISFGVPDAVGQSIARDLFAQTLGQEPEYLTIVYRVNRKQFFATKSLTP